MPHLLRFRVGSGDELSSRRERPPQTHTGCRRAVSNPERAPAAHRGQQQRRRRSGPVYSRPGKPRTGGGSRAATATPSTGRHTALAGYFEEPHATHTCPHSHTHAPRVMHTQILAPGGGGSDGGV